MAKLSDAVSVLARVSGRPEHEVAIHARRAREAGLITQGGRGNSAPDMRVSDIVNLLLTFIGGEFAKDAKRTIKRYRALIAYNRFLRRPNEKLYLGIEAVVHRIAQNGMPSSLQFLLEQHSFGMALEKLILAGASGELERQLSDLRGYCDDLEFRIEMYRPFLQAMIRLGDPFDMAGPVFACPYMQSGANVDEIRSIFGTYRAEHDRETIAVISDRTILALGALLHDETRSGRQGP
jgi:hypothetical protein